MSFCKKSADGNNILLLPPPSHPAPDDQQRSDHARLCWSALDFADHQYSLYNPYHEKMINIAKGTMDQRVECFLHQQEDPHQSNLWNRSDNSPILEWQFSNSVIYSGHSPRVHIISPRYITGYHLATKCRHFPDLQVCLTQRRPTWINYNILCLNDVPQGKPWNSCYLLSAKKFL